MLTKFIQLRNELIKHLVASGLSNFKVIDSCCVTNCILTASISNRIAELKRVSTTDGVHYTKAGYQNLAKRCSDCLKTLLGNKTDANEKRTAPTTFFWRGFRSVGGSMRP
jgi:lysophospholipase L1-like esterase